MAAYEEQIQQLEQQVQQRMNAIAAQDPLCNRLFGRIETLRQVVADQELQTPDLKIEKSDK